MDENEFSFEALFNNPKFIRYTSPAYEKAIKNFYDFLERKFGDFDNYSDLECEATIYCTAAEESGFIQGFCFAVKLMNFQNKILNNKH